MSYASNVGSERYIVYEVFGIDNDGNKTPRKVFEMGYDYLKKLLNEVDGDTDSDFNYHDWPSGYNSLVSFAADMARIWPNMSPYFIECLDNLGLDFYRHFPWPSIQVPPIEAIRAHIEKISSDRITINQYQINQ